MKKTLNKEGIYSKFKDYFENTENYELLKFLVASILSPEIKLIEKLPEHNKFVDHYIKKIKEYKKMILSFDRERYESLDNFGFYFYAPSSFHTIVTNILWGRILTEAFKKFIRPTVESAVQKILMENYYLEKVKWQKTIADKVCIICGPIAGGKSTLIKKIKDYIEKNQPILSAPDELIAIFSSSDSNILIRAQEFLAESWFVKSDLFEFLAEKFDMGLYANIVFETMSPSNLPLELFLKGSKTIEILWNYSSPQGSAKRMIDRGIEEERFVPPSETIMSYGKVYINLIYTLKNIIRLQSSDAWKSDNEININLYNTDIVYKYPENKATEDFVATKEKAVCIEANKNTIVFKLLNLPAFMMLLYYHYAIVDAYTDLNENWKEEFLQKFSVNEALNALDLLPHEHIHFEYEGKKLTIPELKTLIIKTDETIVATQKAWKNKKSLSTNFNLFSKNTSVSEKSIDIEIPDQSNKPNQSN